MSNKKESPVLPERGTAEAAGPERTGESVYTLAQLVQGHRSLNAPRELVSVALRLAGKESFTLSQAREIVNKFKDKEVK